MYNMNIIHDYIAAAILIGIIKSDIKDPRSLDSKTIDLYNDIIDDMYMLNPRFASEDWGKIVSYAKHELYLEKKLS